MLRDIKEGEWRKAAELPCLLRLTLREHLWCKLSYIPLLTADYAGDFYLFLSSAVDCTAFLDKICEQLGLFREKR